MSLSIKEVALHDVWQLRQEVMYPDETLDFVKLEEDETGVHLGVYEGEELKTVISLFKNDGELQFRKFATRVASQGKGYGTYLLEYVMKWASENQIKRIWCNARATATGMYEKIGMRTTGYGWKKFGLDFIMMEKQFN